jgi:hypothetical protein
MRRSSLACSLATSRVSALTTALAWFLTIGGLILLSGMIFSNQLAAADAKYPVALQQCGECHMIFPAKMLPQRSWQAILSNLETHFGENATVSEAERAEILNYLVLNAADSPKTSPRDRHYISELSTNSVPLRITRTAWWNQMHADFDFEGVKRTTVRSAANCLACHPGGFN